MPASTPMPVLSPWNALQQDIVDCERCPRLRTYCRQVAITRRAAFRDQVYWGRPVPNLGSPSARLLIVGLAPAAHGANRTGRLFTGDRSGDFLFEAMYATGFCNQPTAMRADDGLRLIDCAITGAAHCAPPDNKPTPAELVNCQPFLDRTVALMPHLQGILCLGKIGFDTAIALYKRRGWLVPKAPRPQFGNAALHLFPAAPWLLCVYHPSQQNTFTRKLTQQMLQDVFRIARAHLHPIKRDGTLVRGKNAKPESE